MSLRSVAHGMLALGLIAAAQTGPPVTADQVARALGELKRGEDVEANVAFLRGAVAQAADPGAFALQVGATLFKESMFAEARAFLEIARQRRPQDGEVALALGKTQVRLSLDAQGHESLLAAEKLLPPGPRPMLHQHLSKALVGLQRVDEAEARARRAIDEARAWNAALETGRAPLDVHEFELNLAEVLHDTRQPDAALAVLEALPREELTQGDRAIAAALRAKILDVRGDPQAAQAAFEESVAAAPDDPVWLYEFALFHVRRGRVAEARPLLERVVALEPGHEGGWFNLARIRTRLGEKEASEAAMARYAAIRAARVAAADALREMRTLLQERGGD